MKKRKIILTENEIDIYRTTLNNEDIAVVKGYIDKKLFPILARKFNLKNNTKGNFLYWSLDKTDPNKTLNKYIKPAFEFIEKNKKRYDLIFNIEEILKFLEKPKEEFNEENVNISPLQQEEIKNKLENFKNKLINITNDEDFKKIMSVILKLKGIMGYSYSILNTLLIYLQKPNAKIVNNKKSWKNNYNRNIKHNASPILVWKPIGQNITKSKEEKIKIKQEFLNKLNKSSIDQLTPNEKINLESKLRGKTIASNFILTPVYDVSDTIQIKDTFDHIGDYEKEQKNIKYFDDEQTDEGIRPIYKTLKKFCEQHGIIVDYTDDLGGARGVSSNGKITLLTNDGNSIGSTKTLVHEIAHELLHQTYLKNKNLSSFFIGQSTRDVVEQQAELSAWMFMHVFGYDVSTTSLNYTVMWGGNEKNMVIVFETVSKMVNHLIDYVNKNINTLQENIQQANHINPIDIAKFLGIEDKYKKIKQKINIQEILRKKMEG